MEPVELLAIFIAGVIGSSFGTLVGGQSLVTIPTLLFMGIPPHAAIATNRLGMIGQPVAGWFAFHNHQHINYVLAWRLAIAASLGALLGAVLVLNISEQALRTIIISAMVFVLAFMIIEPRIGIERVKHTFTHHDYMTGMVVSFFLGIYGGFFGAGLATFYTLLLVSLFGQTFIQAAATRKIAMVVISALASLVFIISGAVIWPFAVALLFGTSVGSYLGAHYANRIGNLWIKRMFFAVILALALSLFI